MAYAVQTRRGGSQVIAAASEPEGRWMSLREFARFWGVTDRTVYRWIEDKRLPENIVEKTPGGQYRIYERRREPRAPSNLDIP
jgi:excisionase family DNA binding protein